MNKLLDKCNNNDHRSVIDADYCALSERIESSYKAPKVGDRVRISKYQNIFGESYTKNWSREIFVIDSLLKANPWTFKIKDLNGEKLKGNFYEKKLLLSKS